MALRSVGHPPVVTAAEQFQKSFPRAGIQPLPAGSPGRAGASQLGITDSKPLTFFVIGDHGGVTAPGPQNAVSYAMQRHEGAAPAFVYSVGDWVYYGGDEPGWDHQFYEAYAHFPVPFIGIPGNHDDQYGGDPPFDPARGPLDGWMANMCTTAPEVPPADPQFEYQRHTMTQPWCDWTLTLEAVTIIGVYTNVPSGGHLEPGQIDWLQTELQAAPADRLLAVSLHHPPASVDAHHGGSKHMSDALDQAIQATSRVPDLVLSGHVHDFQLFRRTAWNKEIIYLVIGNSGYQNLHQLAHGSSPGTQLPDGFTFEYGDATEYGFLSLTVDGGRVSGEYVGVTPGNMDDGSDAKVTPEKHTF